MSCRATPNSIFGRAKNDHHQQIYWAFPAECRGPG